MTEPGDIPQLAIIAFERLTGLAVCFHDPSRALWPFLPPNRFEHLNPLCHSIKMVRQPTCTAFDSTVVHGRALAEPDGMVKVCHAGLVEWVVPHLADGQLRWVMFAGVRRPAPGLERILADPSPLRRNGPWSAKVAQLPAVDDGEAAWILESLRQLGERLVAWRTQHVPFDDKAVARDGLTRATMIRNFIIRWHTEQAVGLDDLAGHLGLSASRAGHAVVEACGRTFIALLIEARLRTAAGLLRHSSLPLEQVAVRSGFGNRSHFHQQFRRAFGLSPGQYRRNPREG